MPSIPSVLKRTPKPDPEAIYVAIESFVPLDVTTPPVHRGERRLGSSVQVQLGWPRYWVPDGSDQDTINAARQRLYDPTWNAEPPFDPSAPRLLEPIPNEFRLVSTRYIIHKGVQLASSGQVFDSRSEIATALAREYPGALTPEAA